MIMKNAKMAKWMLVVCSSCLLAVGCVVEARGPGGEVEVGSEPPLPRVDVETPIPGPGFLWVGGEWGWEGGRWAWHGGHWDRPPHPGAHWMAGHYETRGGRRVYRRGGWH